jgi:hypothetical protein
VVSEFKGRHFRGEIVLWAVRWYCRYGISYRDLEQMLAERGVSVEGFEVMRALRKGQAAIFNLTRDILGEARLVERAFGLGPCALSEAVQLVTERLQAA